MENTLKNKHTLGRIGEEATAKHLLTIGYHILDRNFSFSRFGEIDIIARDQEYICFIEVKTRSSYIYGIPAEAVTYSKQQNIKKLSQIYLSRYKLHGNNVRFDVVEVMAEKSEGDVRIKSINLIKNAF